MHIIQLVPALQEGGVERGVVEINRALVRRGISSTVISRGGRLVAEIEADGGCHIAMDVCSKNLFTASMRAQQLEALLATLQPDLVHVRSRLPAWLLKLANRRLHLPVVTTVHGLNSVNLYSRIMTRAERVICVSQAVRQHLQQHYDIPDTLLRVIHRGIDAAVFDPAHLDTAFIEHFQREHSLKGCFVATSVGRITQLKDYETFIRGVAAARQEIPNLVGLIVGGTHPDRRNYEKRLHALVHELNLGNAIRFVGSQQKIMEIYTLSQVLVSCSIKPESFGRTLAEALAMERPVIATAHGGALEIVRENQNGLLFTPGNVAELTRCLVAVSRRTFTGLRADVLERFALETMVEKTLAVYREVLAAHADARPPDS